VEGGISAMEDLHQVYVFLQLVVEPYLLRFSRPILPE